VVHVVVVFVPCEVAVFVASVRIMAGVFVVPAGCHVFLVC
jgi:hypothetical protein